MFVRSLTDPAPAFLSLVAALQAPCGVVGGLPDEAWQAGYRGRVGENPAFLLSYRRGLVDPYAGGDVWEQSCDLQGAHRLRVTLAEVAWCGVELRVALRGPPAWEEEVRKIIEEWAR